jgi:hypothetical protein
MSQPAGRNRCYRTLPNGYRLWATGSKSHGGIFDPDAVRREMSELEERSAGADFWKDKEGAGKAVGRLAELRKRIEPMERLRTDYR